jgi:signal transduction histidine kinase
LEHIENGGRHLLSMIDTILTMADAQSGRLEFHAYCFDAKEAVEDVVAKFESAAAARQVRVEVTVNPALSALQLDPMRLRQILLRYVENAIKFSPPGGRIQVRLTPLSSDRFGIEVEDAGIGVRSESLPRLFSEFDQLSVGSTKVYAGVGAGLALVKRLVEAQGSFVAVRSSWGVSSVFVAEMSRRFSLP